MRKLEAPALGKSKTATLPDTLASQARSRAEGPPAVVKPGLGDSFEETSTPAQIPHSRTKQI